MVNTPTAPSPLFVQLHDETRVDTRAELAAGLRAEPAAIVPKYFYDALGSRLFDAITELPEYYPTRTEAAILAAQGAAIAPRRSDAGARWWTWARATARKRGACSRRCSRARYVAVDISVEFLRRRAALPAARASADWRWWAWGWTFRPPATAARSGQRHAHAVLSRLVDRQLHAGAALQPSCAARATAPPAASC